MTPTARRRGRPRASAAHPPELAEMVQLPPAWGIICPYCRDPFAPRLECVRDGAAYATCPGCRARLALTFNGDRYLSVRLV